jgi:MtrB/PioB family decaheme-associated outer membrane protein
MVAVLVSADEKPAEPSRAMAKPPAQDANTAPSDANMPSDWHAGTLVLGTQWKDVNTISSKFMEYRDVPNGLVVPRFRFQGQKGSFRYDVIGDNARQTDQRFRARLADEKWKLEGDYNRIPHDFGNAGHTLLEQTSEGVFQMSDTLQRQFQTTLESANPRSLITYPFLLNLVTPSLAAANQVDIKLTRERGQASFTMKPTDPFEIRVSYSRERRVGSRAASGTSFGFGNVVELPEPLRYLTQDFAVDGQYEGEWGVLQAGLRYNSFENRVESLTFDNPFRASDTTDASAYQAPGSASINGPTTGRMSLPPDNEAMVGVASALFKLKGRTRLSADVSMGSWKQNSSPFLAFSTNTAMTTPGLPAPRLDGKADVTAINAYLTSQPWNRISFTARARSYELDNRTPRLTIPGYARFDASWSDVRRISVPYGFKSERFDATAGYRLDDVSLEVGAKSVRTERTFRETEDTTENGFSVSASAHGSDWLILRASYERSKRDFQHLEIEESEDASFVVPGAPTNLLAVAPTTTQTNGQPLCAAGTVCNLRFDQARKTADRLSGTASFSIGASTTLSASYLRTKDDYTESAFGLITAKLDSFSVDLDVTPGERATLYAFFSHEKIADFQVGRQSGATPSNNPLDNWTSDVDDKVASAGIGGDFTLVPDKWFLNVTGRYQKANGNNTLFAPAGGAVTTARAGIGGVQSLPAYDDSRIASFGAEARRQFAAEWSVSLGAWYEDYRFSDLASNGLTNYVPASFFLAANDGSYKAKVAYVRFSRRW